MGSVTLPDSGVIAVDANIVIYTVEKQVRFRNITGFNVVVLDEVIETH